MQLNQLSKGTLQACVSKEKETLPSKHSLILKYGLLFTMPAFTHEPKLACTSLQIVFQSLLSPLYYLGTLRVFHRLQTKFS